MKIDQINLRQRFQPLPSALLGLVAALAAMYFTLLWKSNDTAHLGMSLLFVFAAGSLLWDKRDNLKLESDLLSTLLGGSLLCYVLWQTATMPDASFLRAMPSMSAQSMGLLAAGWRNIRQFWRELFILFFLGVPSLIARAFPDISSITAKFAGFLLWYLGADVKVEGVFVSLPGGSIEVYAGCSGMESMTYLLGIAVMSMVMFPLRGIKRFFIPHTAMTIGYGVNGLRVALMAKLAAAQNKAAFDYWHEGDGSLIFGLVAIAIFWALYFYLLQRERATEQSEQSEQSD